MEEDDVIELGGSISLNGFKDLASGSMTIIKKIVGSYAKSFSEKNTDFEGLSLTMKKVHETEGSEKYEVHAKLMLKGNPVTAEETDRNLFVVLDSVLKKVEEQVS